jgi:hypothetical protein
MNTDNKKDSKRRKMKVSRYTTLFIQPWKEDNLE